MPRYAVIPLVALLLAACPSNTGNSAWTSEQGPTNVELDTDIDAMRDEHVADVRKKIDEARPTTFQLKGKKELEAYQRDMRRINEPSIQNFIRAVDELRPALRDIAKQNWSLARSDRHRLLRNRAAERQAELNKATGDK